MIWFRKLTMLGLARPGQSFRCIRTGHRRKEKEAAWLKFWRQRQSQENTAGIEEGRKWLEMARRKLLTVMGLTPRQEYSAVQKYSLTRTQEGGEILTFNITETNIIQRPGKYSKAEEEHFLDVTVFFSYILVCYLLAIAMTAYVVIHYRHTEENNLYNGPMYLLPYL